MKWLPAVIILLAGCLQAPTEDANGSLASGIDQCDEDHLSMYFVPGTLSINGTLKEENGFNILTIYRFQCGDQTRELWGLELEPITYAHERFLLKQCGWLSNNCRTTADFKIDEEILLEQYTMNLYETHLFTTKVVKGGDKFAGYTSLWTGNGRDFITIHSVAQEIGIGTFTMTPIPWEHYGIYGAPENLVHMVQDVTVQWAYK